MINDKNEIRRLRYMVNFIFAKIQERMTTEEFINIKRVRLDIMKELGAVIDEDVKRDVNNAL